MFKPFFVHGHHKPGHRANRAPRGFTAFVQAHLDDPSKVAMRVALCSPKDQFSKKAGRSQALISKREVISKRKVPHILACLSKVCELTDVIREQDYYYVYKNML